MDYRECFSLLLACIGRTTIRFFSMMVCWGQIVAPKKKSAKESIINLLIGPRPLFPTIQHDDACRQFMKIPQVGGAT